MRYDYHFYSGNREGNVSTISTTAPLPHIQVGNTLVLELPDLSTKAGYHWEIRGVEVYLFAQSIHELTKTDIHVTLGEQARYPEQ